MRAPAANRRTLVLLAGLLWSAVGLVLIAMATRWLALSENSVIVFVAVGFVCGVAVYRFGFAGLARKNLVRIYEQAPGKDKVCIFAFQNTRSYIIIFVMMLMGYTLRHLPVPKVYISPIYIAVGLGLFLASLTYYEQLKY